MCHDLIPAAPIRVALRPLPRTVLRRPTRRCILLHSPHHTAHLPSIASFAGLGVLSLVFWAITLVVAMKYVVVVMRADGTMALLSLALPAGRYRGLCSSSDLRARPCSTVTR